MTLKKIIRNKKFILYKVESQGHQALEDKEVTAHEAPLASFETAFDALGGVAASVCEMRDDSRVRVHRVDVTQTKRGTRSVQLYFTRTLAVTGQPHPLKTPVVQLDTPAEGESGRREVTEEEALAINTLVEETMRYIKGERQQLLLPLDKSDGGEMMSGDDEEGDDE